MHVFPPKCTKARNAMLLDPEGSARTRGLLERPIGPPFLF